MEFEQSPLFDSIEFRDSEAKKHQSIFIHSELPEFPELEETPKVEYEVWHEDGIGMFTSTAAGVICGITGLKSEEISNETVRGKIAELKSEGKWGRAFSVAWASNDHLQTTDFVEEENLAARAYIHLALKEAQLLPFEDGSGITKMLPKHLTSILSFLEKKYIKDPETYRPYVIVAAEINAEMVCKFPDLFEYEHAMWKTSDSTKGKHELKAFLGESLQTEDEEYKERTSNFLKAKLEAEFNRENYGRSGAISTLGRETLLLDQDTIVTDFERKFSQLDLKTELVEDLIAMNQMVVPLEPNYPKLTYLKGIANDMYLTDSKLADRLKAIVNNRILEVANLLLVESDTPDNVKRLLNREIEEVSLRMPDDDPRKKEVAVETLDNLIKDYVSSEGTVSAGDTDRLIEKIIDSLAKKYIDADKFFISITEISDKVFKSVFESELRNQHYDTLETIVGYMSPFCRYKLNEIPDSITEYLKMFLYNMKSKKSGEDAKFFGDLHAALEESPHAMLKAYWEIHEEYYS